MRPLLKLIESYIARVINGFRLALTMTDVIMSTSAGNIRIHLFTEEHSEICASLFDTELCREMKNI